MCCVLCAAAAAAECRVLQSPLLSEAVGGQGGWCGCGARVAETRWLANRNSRNVALISPLRQQVAESVTAAPTVTHMSNCIGTSSLTARYEVRQAPTVAFALLRTQSGRSSKYVDNSTQSLCHLLKNCAFSLKAPYFSPTCSTVNVSQGVAATDDVRNIHKYK